MKIIKLLALPFLLLFMAGCDTFLGLTPEAKIRSIYDPRTVYIKPQATKYNGGLGTGVGAMWTESAKGKAAIVIEIYGEFADITGAELNIDGRMLTLTPVADMPTHTRVDSGIRISSRGFITDLAMIKKILRTKSTWLRVEMSTESRESAIIDGGSGSEAYNALVTFMKAVKGL